MRPKKRTPLASALEVDREKTALLSSIGIAPSGELDRLRRLPAIHRSHRRSSSEMSVAPEGKSRPKAWTSGAAKTWLDWELMVNASCRAIFHTTTPLVGPPPPPSRSRPLRLFALFPCFNSTRRPLVARAQPRRQARQTTIWTARTRSSSAAEDSPTRTQRGECTGI